ncbi:ribosome biogenesis protein SLX9 homolog isoform X3 [Canis lupus baileyi]|uniref:ribosome biogenesis protein SLX9 homolog isoform X3 n=1 Tax=Canis lupus dingo TaxID=286419 RepID=UPI0015F18385|nr:ribosome biogenesis protein SLX9 homolog isoform X3 [Canis lupus dingo]XP_038299625.1 protein FAM207A isoform X5 [Canis lupus familiaris]XP_038317706.1 protein FAM207A isoform X5 [Canis lupus familiaris]XP_038437586.1 protein FAM207A isoform X5 [Canis lupus familiaris]
MGVRLQGMGPASCPSVIRALGGGTWECLVLCMDPLPPQFGTSQSHFISRTFFQFLDGLVAGGAEARTVLPKKEKLKLRRERWLQKIEAIKLAEQKRKAERRRRATVVVGDLQPLRDALPELLELEAAGRQPRTRGRVSSRPRPAEFSRMSAAQRLQLLEEESARFRELLANPTYRASPLLAIGQRLAQQIQLDSGSQL